MTDNKPLTITDPENGGDVENGWSFLALPVDKQAVALFLGDGSGPLTIDDTMLSQDIPDYIGSSLSRRVFIARLRWIADAIEAVEVTR